MNISGEAIIIVVFLVVLLITVLLLYVRKIVAYKNIYNKYKGVKLMFIDLEYYNGIINNL